MKTTKVLALAAALASTAHATDGVIEINAAKVAAAGGYPYVISQPGSYRLTSNLTQPDKDTDVIDIVADNVTLDLNGFAIIGPNTCTPSGAAIVCTASGLGDGIYSGGASYLLVRNGSIRGAGNNGIELAFKSDVENVRVSECGGIGIAITGSVRRVHVATCAHDGISANDVTHSTSEYNGGDGIHFIASGSAIGNRVENNKGVGIFAGMSRVLFTQNILQSNAGGATGGIAPHSLPANSNLCDSSPC